MCNFKWGRLLLVIQVITSGKSGDGDSGCTLKVAKICSFQVFLFGQPQEAHLLERPLMKSEVPFGTCQALVMRETI